MRSQAQLRSKTKFVGLHRLDGDFLDTIDRINIILKERGMTGADLSRKIGVSTAVYSQWNRKRTNPSNKNIAKVAEVLGVSVSELIGEGQKEKPPAHGGEPLDPVIRELLEIVDTSTPAEREMMLDMIRIIKKQRKE